MTYELPLRPPAFREACGVTHAKLEAIGPQFAARKVRVAGARALGIRYEKRVHAWLLQLYPKHYLANPWFRFVDEWGTRWCQPDGLLIDPVQGVITIIEVKHSHTGQAWWKLQKLYLQVVRATFGADWNYRCVEVVRYFDPAMVFPLRKLCELIHAAPLLPHTGVHIWKPSA